jgi:hypothetical protein
VYILKVLITIPPFLHNHVLGQVPLFVNLGVELDFLPSDGIDKGHDDLEKSIDQEGNVDDECQTQSLGIVFLEDIEDGSSSANGGVLGPITEINQKSKISVADKSGKETSKWYGCTYSTPGPMRSTQRSAIQKAN